MVMARFHRVLAARSWIVALLAAVVAHAGDASLAEAEAMWRDEASLERKLEAFQSVGPICWFEAMQQSPNWAELMDGLNREAATEFAHMEAKWIAAILAMLKADNEAGARGEDELRGVAEFVYSASKNAKYGVSDLNHLKRRLSTIKRAALALLRSD